MLPLLSLLATLLASLPTQEDLDLTVLSLEELMGLELSSASRKEQPLSDASAAVYVITAEDIRRSGATSIPEALRLAPGVHVARIAANSWAVGVRGFNSRYTNKLLVMIDGRTIYTNLFSGVVWESLGLPIEVIERIEVIRGPGGTMWGANAVNGVINVITLSAADTQGSDLALSGGDEESHATGIHGGALEDGAWRAHVTGGVRDDAEGLDGGSGRDSWRNLGAGFRADWGDPEGDSFTVTADVSEIRPQRAFDMLDPSLPGLLAVDEEFEYPWGSVLGRWTRKLDDGELSLQGFLDYRAADSTIFEDERSTLDLDLQHRVRLGERHELLWGAGYRVVASDYTGSPAIAMMDENRTDHLFSVFAQDEVRLGDDVTLTFGTKVEHNDLTGFEVQPSVRALRHVGEKSSVWGAVSRAVRIPSHTEHEILFPAGFAPGMPPVLMLFTGNDDFESEDLLAYEIGYRTQATERLFVDVAAYWFEYDDLSTVQLGTPIPGPIVIQPLVLDNAGEGREIGVEVACDWRVTDAWRLRGALAVSDLDVDDGGAVSSTTEDAERNHPSYVANLGSYLALGENVDLDLALYAVDELELAGIDSYVRADARIAWRPKLGLELALGVQNLTDDAHQEFGTDFLSESSKIERAVYASLRWNP
jgi:iron complex outermembrane receptor protein